MTCSFLAKTIFFSFFPSKALNADAVKRAVFFIFGVKKRRFKYFVEWCTMSTPREIYKFAQAHSRSYFLDREVHEPDLIKRSEEKKTLFNPRN